MAWITDTDVENALGLPPASSVDTAWLTECTAAANDLAWRRRQAARYVYDDPDSPPDAAVKLGTTQMAVLFYRQRGSADGYAGFEELGIATPTPLAWHEILRLLGCGRPATG